MTFPILGGNGAVAGYEIDNSLRFIDGDSPRLTRSHSASASTFTYSTWVKRGTISNNYQYFFSYEDSGGSGASGIGFHTSTDTLYYYNGASGIQQTSAVFRDVSAWYHIVLKVTSNTGILYVNGVEVKTGISVSSFTSGENMTLGVFQYGSTLDFYFDGYMAETYLIDGTAKAPTDFGEFDSDSGIWKPKAYSGSYGTNGFHLDFEDSSSLGNDVSGNNNDFTATNLASTDQTIDTPTNNWCTLNALDTPTSGSTFSEGNLKIDTNTSQQGFTRSTFAVSQGKWYFEAKITTSNVREAIGITLVNIGNFDLTGKVDYYSRYGHILKGNSLISTQATYGNNDRIGVAFNLDDNTVAFYKNGSLQDTVTSIDSGTYSPMYRDGSDAYTCGAIFNFGNNGSFAGTETAQGNADDNGFGDFYYSPPSGYLALCTQNLATALSPTIDDGSEHFNIVLWSGNSVDDRSITGVGFAPDLVSIKNRDASTNFYWYDTTRGADNQLLSNATNSESTITNKLQAFESDGFQLGTSSEVNSSSNTYVGWSWKAGGTTPSQTYTVKVVSDSGNKYRFDDFGTSAVTLDLQEGGTYTFDQSDSSNSGHPLRFSTTSDGTHGSGYEYTTGVTTTGTPGSAGAKTVITVSASAPTLYYYCSVHSGMGGQANTNSTHGSSNFAGSIQSVAQANTTAGFSVVTWTGSGSSNETVGHGLSSAPTFVIQKPRSEARHWIIWSNAFGDNDKGALFNNETPADNRFGPNAPTSSVFGLYGGQGNRDGTTFVAYCFHDVEGYSKFGSYTGNGSNDGAFVYTGFRPAFVMIKRTDSSSSWSMRDTARSPYNLVTNRVWADLSNAESTSTTETIDILSNGFKARNNIGGINTSGGTYIFMSFAENPFVSSSGVPVVAR